LSPEDINYVLDLADGYVELNRQAEKKRALLRSRRIINCFFENSTRTRTSFEVAGKRLGGDADPFGDERRSMSAVNHDPTCKRRVEVPEPVAADKALRAEIRCCLDAISRVYTVEVFYTIWLKREPDSGGHGQHSWGDIQK
jgi:hypothetical protein